jgi:acylphosphatase
MRYIRCIPAFFLLKIYLDMTIQSYFRVEGRVQGVMFRQTFIRAAQQRGLTGAATNLPDGSVSCFLSGAEAKIGEILERLRSGREINSWGARVERLVPLDLGNGMAFDKHQVTTDNVDSYNWSPDVEMYL